MLYSARTTAHVAAAAGGRGPTLWLRPVAALLIPTVFVAGLASAAPPVAAQRQSASPVNGRADPAPNAAAGCGPTSGRIIQDICGVGLSDVYLRAWEDDMVEMWLAAHSIPLSDASKVYDYGRTDLRSELRSFMLTQLLEIIRKTDRNPTEAAVYAWFQKRVWDLEKEYWDKAVQLRDQFYTQQCTGWTPDPEVAAQYGLSYDPSWCTNTLLNLFSTPKVPVMSYFTTTALKQTYGQRIADDPNGPEVLAETTANLGLIVAISVTAAALVALTATLAIPTVAAAILPFTLISGATLSSLVALGPLAILAAGALIAITAGIQAVEQQQNQNDLNSLTILRNNAYAAPPNLSGFISDKLGSYKLTAAFIDATLPEFSSAAPPPARTASDAPFNVTPSGGSPQTVDEFTWTDWDGEPWEAYASGAWLVGTQSDTAERSFGTTFRFLDWAGGKYTASRMGRRFLVVKAEPDGNDVRCLPDTLSLATQGDVSNCSSWVTYQVNLKDADGDNVSVAFPGTPEFTSRNRTAFRTTIVPAAFEITATGFPMPSVDLAPGSSAPTGMTFLDSDSLAEPGKAMLQFDGATPNGTYTMTVRAANGAGFRDQTITVDVAPNLAITSPAVVPVQVGVPYQFHVTAVGVPPLAFFKDGSWGPIPSFTFHDNGDGSATISGLTQLPNQLGCINWDAEFNNIPCLIHVVESGGASVAQALTFDIQPAPVPWFTSPPVIEMDRGIYNEKVITATNDYTGVLISSPCSDRPAWLNFYNALLTTEVFLIGDGNATLYGTPPVDDTVEEFNVYLHARAHGLGSPLSNPADECASGAYVSHTIRLVPRPRFLGASSATLTVGHAATIELTKNLPGAEPAVTVIGSLPAGMSLVMNGNGQYELTGTPANNAGGIYNPVFSMANDYGSAELPFTLTVLEQPELTSPESYSFLAGTAIEEAITASGFPRDQMEFHQGLFPPPFLSFDQPADFAVVTGTPSDAHIGQHSLTVTIFNQPSFGESEFKINKFIGFEVKPPIGSAVTQVCPNSTGNTASAPAGLAAYGWTIANGAITDGTSARTVTYSAGASGEVGLTLAANATGLAPASTTVTLPIVAVAPDITDEPDDAKVHPGDPVTFTVAADVIGPVSFQWRKNGGDIPGAIASSYSIAAAQGGHEGDYDVVIRACGSTSTSAAATLVVTPDVDGDGVADGIENAGPNGGNGNGYLTLASSCALLDVSVTTEKQVGPDLRFHFPFGLIAFRAPCPAATFSLFAHGTGHASLYRKYGPVPPGSSTSTWYTLPGVTISRATIGDSPVTRVDFTLEDGVLGDDTAVDGVIVDQGGPVEAAPVPLADPRTLLLYTILLAAAGWVALRRMR